MPGAKTDACQLGAAGKWKCCSVVIVPMAREAVGAIVNDIETAVRRNAMAVYRSRAVESPDAFDIAGERRDGLMLTINLHLWKSLAL